MAWNVGAFGANAWNFGEVTVSVTSSGATASHAVGSVSITQGTGAVFGVTSSGAIASHAVGSVSTTQGTGTGFGVTSANAFATGHVGEEVVWFDIPTNTATAAGYEIISTAGASGSWTDIIG